MTQGHLTQRVTESKIKMVKQDKFPQMISLVSQLGLSISLPIVGGAFLGQFLDKTFHLYPKMTLFLIFLGVFIAGSNIYFLIKKLEED
mgnify:CR=1 FL=1